LTQTKAHYRAYLKSPEWKEKRQEILEVELKKEEEKENGRT
jgi:hypothetical protein